MIMMVTVLFPLVCVCVSTNERNTHTNIYIADAETVARDKTEGNICQQSDFLNSLFRFCFFFFLNLFNFFQFNLCDDKNESN